MRVTGIFTILLCSVGGTLGGVTQHLTYYPWACLYTDADAATGTVWAYMDFCSYDESYYFTDVLPDGTLHSVMTGKCLDAGDMGEGAAVTFSDCEAGSLPQNWTYIPDNAIATQVHGSRNLSSGMIVLSASVSADSGKTCLMAPSGHDPNSGFDMGTRVAMVSFGSLDSFLSDLVVWSPQPPPPENKTVIMLDALRDVGLACVVRGTYSGPAHHPGSGSQGLIFADCEVNQAMKFWVPQETSQGILFRMSVDLSLCLGVGWNVECDTEPVYWVHNETTGALQVTDRLDEGCLDWELKLTACSDSWTHKFVLGSDAPRLSQSDSPPLIIYNVGQCVDQPGWYDGSGWSCIAAASHKACRSTFPRHGKSFKTGCCYCQDPMYLSPGQASSSSMAATRVLGWAMVSGMLMFKEQCLGLTGDDVQMQPCDSAGTWAYNRSTGSIASVSRPGYCLQSQNNSVALTSCEDGMGWQMVFAPKTASVVVI